MKAATWWALYHASRPSRAKSACPRCRCDVVKGVHHLGPGGPGQPYRIKSPVCPVDVLRDPEVESAIKEFCLGEQLGLPLFAGTVGEQDHRKATLAALVASEVPWVHAAIRRASEESRG